MKGSLFMKAQTLPGYIRLGWKGLPETNALAYFASLSVTKDKV